jgi:hypothetical protein
MVPRVDIALVSAFGLHLGQSLRLGISSSPLPSGQTVFRRFQATSRLLFGWVHKPFARLTPSGFALGTPLLCSPPSRGDALVLQRLARPPSTGTDGESCIHEVLRSAQLSVRRCCVPKVGKSKSVNQLALEQGCVHLNSSGHPKAFACATAASGGQRNAKIRLRNSLEIKLCPPYAWSKRLRRRMGKTT